MALREYSGNSKSTTLAGDISAAATSITVADGTGYPTGAVGPFVVTIDAGLAGEEKVLCTSRTGNTLTVTSRGWDGTSAADHSNAATVQHTLSATDIREANAHVNEAAGTAHGGVVSTAGGSTVTASGAAVKGLVVKGAASQTANLIEFQTSAGTPVTAINNVGVPFRGGSWVFNHEADENAKFEASAAAKKGLVVRGAASQTANLAEFQNSAGTLLAGVAASGQPIFNHVQISTGASAGGASALPGAPQDYLNVTLANGATRRIPMWNP